MYIVTQLMSKKDKEKLEQTFMALDTNADGKLSREELIKGYSSLYNSPEQANKEVDVIMENVDVDHNGYIDYSGMPGLDIDRIEFLIASTNKQKLLSKDNLKRSFQLFDKARQKGLTKVGQERVHLGRRGQGHPGSGETLLRAGLDPGHWSSGPEQRRADIVRGV